MKYKILWDRNDYGNIIIEAETEEKARELFETGEFEEKDLNYKGGGMELVTIEQI